MHIQFRDGHSYETDFDSRTFIRHSERPKGMKNLGWEAGPVTIQDLYLDTERTFYDKAEHDREYEEQNQPVQTPP